MTKIKQQRAREQYLKDYVSGSLHLFWKRQAMYLGAFILAISYYGAALSTFSYLIVLLTEIYDHFLDRRIHAWDDHDPQKTNRFYHLVIFGTALNALAISFFVLMAAWAEGTDAHFTPLLLLFAAALFAAMNTHQIVPALTVRLCIYSATFLAVSARNVVILNPPLTSYHWLHLFTVVFVVYFIVDCSLAYLKLYRENLKQLDELRKGHASAVDAHRAKSEFLSVVSHELRTPLTSIKGALNLADSGKVGQIPSSIAGLFSIANKNANRLAILIDDLLDLQAIEAGKLTMSFQPTDLLALVRESMEGTTSYLKDKHVRMKFIGEQREVMVVADARRLMQVMANVLSNAIKFSNDDGLVEIDLKVDRHSATISVRDHGTGIPPGREDQVFSAFSQVDLRSSRLVNGSGLGMSVSKQIMLEHDGDISYQSELGAGTVFFITIPLAKGSTAVSKPSANGHAGDPRILKMAR